MNENEEKTFQIAYQFFAKWRETVIETDEQWNEYAQDMTGMAVAMDIANNPLGLHMLTAIGDTFNDLYRGGMKPMPANYFGRDDIGH